MEKRGTGSPFSDVAATSSKIETSEKRESVPLDVAATSPEIQTSEKAEPVPLDVAVMLSEIETSEKGELLLSILRKSHLNLKY